MVYFCRIRCFFVLCFCVLFLVSELAIGQYIPEDKILYYEVVVLSLDTADVCLSHEIAVTDDILAVAFRKAMTHYPELCDRKIQLRYGRIKTSMAAYPRIWSVFRKSDKRTYKVVVNNNPRKAQAQLIYVAPFFVVYEAEINEAYRRYKLDIYEARRNV